MVRYISKIEVFHNARLSTMTCFYEMKHVHGFVTIFIFLNFIHFIIELTIIFSEVDLSQIGLKIGSGVASLMKIGFIKKMPPAFQLSDVHHKNLKVFLFFLCYYFLRFVRKRLQFSLIILVK